MDEDSYSCSICKQAPNVTEHQRQNGHAITLTWLPAAALMSTDLVTQVYGLCLDRDQRLVLVSQDGESWTLPGGRPESGEPPEATLAREVREEACAHVSSQRYLGAQRIDDPTQPEPYYQLRYLARVTLKPFDPQYEMRFRQVVDIATARRLLWRGESRIGQRLLDEAELFEE